MKKPYKYDLKLIQQQNRHDQRRLTTLQSAISFKEFERDYKAHIKYVNNIAKNHRVLQPPMHLGQVLDVLPQLECTTSKSPYDQQAEYLGKSRLMTKLSRHCVAANQARCAQRPLMDEDYDFKYDFSNKRAIAREAGQYTPQANDGAKSTPASQNDGLENTTNSVQWLQEESADFAKQAASSVQHIPIVRESDQASMDGSSGQGGPRLSDDRG